MGERATLFNSSLLPPRQKKSTIFDLIPWWRAILTIYLVSSISFRFAFLPEFTLSFSKHPGFIVLDLLATIFFSYETIRLAKVTKSLISRSTILPSTVDDYSRVDSSVGHSLRSHDESVDEEMPPQRSLSYWRVIFYVFSTVPLEYLSIIFLDGWTNYLLLNRLLRLFYLPKYLRDLSTVLVRKGHLNNIGVRRTWLLFFTMALAGHLCACGFYFVAWHQASVDGVALTWPEVAGIYKITTSTIAGDGEQQVQVTMTSTAAEAYINSLYWAYITMITTGFGDIVPLQIAETITCVLTMFIGVLITALTIANLQRTIGQFDAARLSFQRKMELIKKFLHYRGLSKEIQERVTSFYDYQWRTLKGADEEQFLTELPRTLQQQVTNYMCRDIIASLPLLRKANKALLNALVECAEMNIYSPNENIVKAGEKIRGAILVSRGEILVLKGGVTERKMKRLDRFAQDCLFVDKASVYDVKSKGFSEVIVIPRSEFQQVIKYQCTEEHIAQLKETACAASKATKKANKMFGSGEDSTPTNGLKKYLHPNSFARKLWDCLVLFGLVFYLFSIPLSFMHLLENTSFSATPALLCLGYVVDIFFLVDSILEWNYFFYREESGLVVFDRDHIRQHYYQQHNLALEIIGLIPFDLVSFFFSGRYCHYTRLVKLVRLPNIGKYMESIEVLLAQLKIDIDLSLYRVIKLNLLMILVVQWVGCLWYLMASLSILLGYTENWRQADENDDLLSISHSDFGGFTAYLRSVYWAIVGMSTVGYGDIVPTNIIEMTFATVVILFGGLVLPAVVGGLASYLSHFHVTENLFRKRIAKVRMYLLRIATSEEVLDKVSRYYDYHWSCQGGIVEQDVVNELPTSLRNAVSSHIGGSLVHSLPFLCKCDEATMQLVASVLVPRVFMPKDIIVQEGERGVEMYFIKSGQVVVTSSELPESAPLRVLSRDDFFGESCLLGSKTSGATVTACTYCECLSLNRDDFQQATAGSKQVKIDLANLVIQAKTKNKRAMQNFAAHPKCQRLAMEPTTQEQGSTSSSTGHAMFLPGSLFLLLWSTFLLGICVYNAWIIPFRLAFDTSNNSMIIDWVFDAFFGLDMVLNYLFIAHIQNGELITDARKIRHHYMISRFKMDLISTLPFDLIGYYMFPGTPIVGELARLLKMIRLPRHFGTLEKLFLFLEDHHFSLAGLRLVEFLSGVVLFAHWAACGFFFFARWKSSRAVCLDIGCAWEGTWLQKQIYDGKLPSDGGSTWQQYIRSFNWALPTLVVVVIGDVVPITSPETLYAFLLMAIGVTVNAAIVGNVANIVANLESDSSDFAQRVDQIRNYMHKHHLNYDLHARVDEFTRYLWSAHSGNVSEDDFVLRLPYTLQTDVIAQTRTRLLIQCPFFDFFTNDIVKALALCLKPLTFSPGEIVCAAGDYGQSMFFLERGTMQVVPSDGSEVLATLTSGSFFGETALFLKQPRSSSVCAVTFCDVFELAKVDLFYELRRRDIDSGRMLTLFASIHEKNSSRNQAVAKNLGLSKKDGTKLNKMIDSVDDSTEEKRALLDIFMPGSLFRFCIDLSSLALIIYFCCLVPYNLAFRAEEVARVVPFDVAVDLYFMVDMYLRSTCFAFTRNGSVCTDKKSILQEYIKSGMVVDVLSCLSILEVFVSVLPLRLLSLLRVFRISSFIKKIRDHLALREIRISLATNLLGKIILFYALTNHWVACMWFIIHRFVERNVENTWATSDCPLGGEAGSEGCLATWDNVLGEHNVCNQSMSDCYLRALHFSLTTLSTVGYGDISPVTELETVWENIVVLVGACFLAGLIGAFGACLTESDTIGLNSFKEKIQKLKQYLTYRHIPEDIQASILFFHHCRWKDSQTLDERETLSILPEPLQLDISFAVKQRVIRLVPVLNSLPDIVQKRIAHALILQVYSLREHPIIYSQGDIGFEIYFIASGVVSIELPKDFTDLDETSRANATANKEKFDSIGLILSAGNHVGESCLCSKSGVRQETVVARTKKVELYVLSKDDLNDICRLMGPDKGRNLKQAILSRNNKNWHSFDEIEGIDDDWDDFADTSPQNHSQRQNSLERNNSFFPWSTPQHMNEQRNARGTNRRRRMSQPRYSARIDVLLQERLNDDETTSSIND